MKKLKKCWLLACLCCFSLFLFSCNSGGAATESGNPETIDEKAIIKETQKVCSQISEDLSAGKTEAVLKQLDSNTILQIGSELDLSSPGAKKLAEAISSAKAVQAHATIVFYETVVEGENLSFYIIKEGAEWKLGGL
jgi:hypothetical protein